jgi:hypothetical protein
MSAHASNNGLPPPFGWYQWLQKHLGDHPFTVIFSSISFVAFGALIWWLANNTAGASEASNAVATNRLVALVGGLLGWLIGMAFAPFSDKEKKHFEFVGKTVSVFVSGYVLGKLDRFLELALLPSGGFDSASWQRVGLFGAAFLLGGIVVFTHRLYAFRSA